MNNVKIHGSEYPINKIFSDDFVFSIPPCQRQYAWTTDNCEALLEDLLLAIGDNITSIDDVNPYFLGSIVLIKGDTPNSEIIDGQQRLTTLTILLSALRASLPDDLSQDITPFIYQEGNKLKGTPNIYRMSLREQDADFFIDYIQTEKGISQLKDTNDADLKDSQKLLKYNAFFFMKKLKELDREQKETLAQFILIKCFLVVVYTPDFDSAYRIFSVLNDRGVNLSKSDIFKAEIIGKIKSKKEKDRYSDKWEDCEDLLGTQEFDFLLKIITIIKLKDKRPTNLVDDLRKIIDATNVKEFIDKSLIPYGNAFFSIKNFVYKHNETEKAIQVNNLLRWLNRIGNSDWLPLAIHFLSHNNNYPDKLIQFFTKLERLAAGLMIQDITSYQRQVRYREIFSLLEQEKILYDSNSPLNLDDIEKEKILSKLDGNMYLKHKKKNTTCRYVLLRLDTEMTDGNPSYEYSIVSIEHILPQKPNGTWLNSFGNEKKVRENVDRLGNLVLLSRQKNKEAQNYDFQRKKEIYFRGNSGVPEFSLTLEILDYHDWTPRKISERQERLIEILKQVWDL